MAPDLTALARGPGFCSQHSCDPDNSTPEDPMLSSGVHEYQAPYGAHTHMQAKHQNTENKISRSNLLKRGSLRKKETFTERPEGVEGASKPCGS